MRDVKPIAEARFLLIAIPRAIKSKLKIYFTCCSSCAIKFLRSEKRVVESLLLPKSWSSRVKNFN